MSFFDIEKNPTLNALPSFSQLAASKNQNFTSQTSSQSQQALVIQQPQQVSLPETCQSKHVENKIVLSLPPSKKRHHPDISKSRVHTRSMRRQTRSMTKRIKIGI